jgi:alpha-beta hydrolase superfamily lysophospholipase
MNKSTRLITSETSGRRRTFLQQTALASLLILLLAGLANTVAATWLDRWSTLMQDPAEVHANLPPLELENPRPPSSEIYTYFNAYGFNAPGYEHTFGTFQSGDFTLAAHTYRPDSPRGTVILMHGFFDHTGTIAQTIHHLLEQGFAVAAYDMPGHGLSSGRAAHIEDFADYERSLEDFLSLCQEHMPPPFHALAHSTGAAILVTRLLTHPEKKEFQKIVLVSPLVRSAYWHLSGISANFFDIFMQDVPRVFRDNTSDENFLKAVRSDPLQAHQTSFEWMDALIDWNKRIASYAPSQQPILIIQGDEDSVVDWDYNLEFLGERFPNASIEMIDNGRHQLLGEAPRLREQVYHLIDQWLED